MKVVILLLPNPSTTQLASTDTVRGRRQEWIQAPAAVMAKSLDLSKFNYKSNDKAETNVEKQTTKRKRELDVKQEEKEDPSDLSGSKQHKQDWPGPLPPLLENNLRIVFVGFNPGVESGRTGHYYAHHSNRFWKYLFWSGFTETLHAPTEDKQMPALYRIGFTDLVPRCTKGIQELSKQEMLEGSISLEKRVEKFEPRVVCFVGRGIWEAVAKARGWNTKEFTYGIDASHKFAGNSILCCVPSTSGLNSMKVDKQLASWKEVYTAANPKDIESTGAENKNGDDV